MAYVWGFHQLSSTDQEPSAWTLPPIDWHIRVMSRHSPKKPYHLDLAEAMKAPGVGKDLVDSDSGNSSAWTAGAYRVSPHRLAVLIYAAPDGSDHEGRKAFIEAAEKAASGGAPSGYLVGPDDVCDHGLIIRVSIDHLLKALGDENGVEATVFVGSIRDHWERFARQSYGTTDVPVRLFMQGPTILAFALAALFPPDSRLVPWTRPVVVKPGTEVGMPEIVAIVDGDDVGAGMERELLSGNLDTAIEYSRRMGSVMTDLVKRMATVPGVKVLSTGGDSAIFAVSQASLRSFEQSLEGARTNLDYRFSCGYGINSREAFVALRAAKASGKNITIGSI